MGERRCVTTAYVLLIDVWFLAFPHTKRRLARDDLRGAGGVGPVELSCALKFIIRNASYCCRYTFTTQYRHITTFQRARYGRARRPEHRQQHTAVSSCVVERPCERLTSECCKLALRRHSARRCLVSSHHSTVGNGVSHVAHAGRCRAPHAASIRNPTATRSSFTGPTYRRRGFVLAYVYPTQYPRYLAAPAPAADAGRS